MGIRQVTTGSTEEKSKGLSRRALFIGAGAAVVGAPIAAWEGWDFITTGPNLASPYGLAKPPLGGVGEGSHFAAALAQMLRGEADRGWTPSKIFLQPDSYRVDTAGFDRGQADVFGRLIDVLRDTLSRQNTNSPIDNDLKEAYKLVNRGEDQWFPGIRTTGNYREAARLIDKYNDRVANGMSGFYVHNNSLSAIMPRPFRISAA